MRRRYSDEERAAALAALKANGGNLELTSRQAGVPRNTLRRWAEHPEHAASSQVRQEKMEELSVLFDRVARVYIGRALTDEAVSDTRGKDAVIAAATATDKKQLLGGKPTLISDQRHTFDLSKLNVSQLEQLERLLSDAAVT